MSDEKRAAIVSLLTTAENLAHDLSEGKLAYLIGRALDEARASHIDPDGTAPLKPS